MPCDISDPRAIPQIGRSHLPNQGHSHTRAHRHGQTAGKKTLSSPAVAREKALGPITSCYLPPNQANGTRGSPSRSGQARRRRPAAPLETFLGRRTRFHFSEPSRSAAMRGSPSLPPPSIRMELISALCAYVGTLCSVTPCFGETARLQSGSLRRR